MPLSLWLAHSFATRDIPGTAVYFVEHLYIAYGLMTFFAVMAAVLVLAALQHQRGVETPGASFREILLGCFITVPIALFMMSFPIIDPQFAVARIGDGFVDLRGDLLPMGRISTGDISALSLERAKNGLVSLTLQTGRGTRKSWGAENCRDLLPLARHIVKATDLPIKYFADKQGFKPASAAEVCP